MTISDTYRILGDDERIIAGDQFKMAQLSDEYWSPVDSFIGSRPRDFSSPLLERVVFRRLIVRGEVAV